MFNELSDLFTSYLTNNKNAKRVLVFSVLGVILFILFTQFFLKGTLKLSSDGADGDKVFLISKVEQDSKKQAKPKSYKQGSVSLRLSAGKYRVELQVTDPTATNKVSKTFKYIDIKSRQTKSDTITAYSIDPISVKDTIDKAGYVSLQKDQVEVTSVYGVTSSYGLNDDSKQTIRKEPAFLNRVVGICRFENGKALALNSNGTFYRVDGYEATELDVASYASSEELPLLEQNFYFNINRSANFICKQDSVLVYDAINISSDFLVTFTNQKYNSDNYRNSYFAKDGGLWLFDKVDSDSFDHDSSVSEIATFKKTIKYIDPSGDTYETDLKEYASDVVSFGGSNFCYFYKEHIKCGDIKDKSLQDVVKLEENKEISGIASIDSKKILYSMGDSVMLFNKETEESSELYGSTYTIIPYTLKYNPDNKLVVFGAQKISGSNSSYNLPVIKIN